MNGNYPELTGTTAVLDDNYNGGRMLVESDVQNALPR